MSNSSTSDFLDKLSSLKNDFKVYVPSVKKEVVASPITLKQQKDIISTTVNGVLGALQFTETINNVILDNVEGSDFFAFDRVPIILGLRCHSLGDNVKVANDEIVSIKPNLKKAKKSVKFKLVDKVTIDTIKIDLRIPTLVEENQIIKKCILEIDKIKSESLSEAMGLIYIFELIKHIDSVTVDDQTIIFNDLKVLDRVKIVEQLPLELYEKITIFLQETSEFDKYVLSVEDTSITLDATLFDASSTT
tara:strand:+ start:1170 stop:1913 length:744 start_codon:yes stop_codon:yes gene_type:complete